MENLLFSTFITHEEILDWDIRDQHIRSALVNEAYGRWLIDKETAEFYADCWAGTVAVLPFGYYVRLEAGDDAANAKTRITIPHEMIERARELVADLRSIGKEIDALGIDEWQVIAHLDEEANHDMDALADEYMALLANAGLIEPLVEETE